MDGSNNIWAALVNEESAIMSTTAVEHQPHDFLVCLVDVRQSMLATNVDGVAHMACALRTVASIMALKAQQDPSASISVVLLGTVGAHTNLYAFPDVHTLCSMDTPNADTIIRLRKFADSVTPLKTEVVFAQLTERDSRVVVEDTVVGFAPSTAPLPLGDGLWEASAQLQKVAKPRDTKRIYVFTNDDMPVHVDGADQNRSAVATKACTDRVRIAADDHQEILLWPIQRRGARDFAIDAWWSGVLQPVIDAEAKAAADVASADSLAAVPSDALSSGFVPPSEGRWADTEAYVRRRVARKRVFARLPLTIVDGLHIAVAVHYLVYPARKPSATYVTVSGDRVRTASRYLTENGRPLEEHERIKYVMMGGEMILFNDADRKTVRRVVGSDADGAGTRRGDDWTASERFGHVASTSETHVRVDGQLNKAAATLNAPPPQQSTFEHASTRGESSVAMDARVVDVGGASAATRTATVSITDAVAASVPPSSAPEQARVAHHVTPSERGLTIVGFKPQASIRAIDNVRAPIFVYPSERDLSGSTAAFRVLWERCMHRGVVAIALYAPREGASARFIAMWPQEQTLDDRGFVVAPAGMLGIFLPFADDVRTIVAEQRPGCTPSTAEVDAAKQLVRALHVDSGGGGLSGGLRHDEDVDTARAPPPFSAWDPGVANPVLQKFYRGLESLALHDDKSWNNDTDDSSRPRTKEKYHEPSLAAIAGFVAACGLTEAGGGPPQAVLKKARKTRVPTATAAAAGTKRRRVPAARRSDDTSDDSDGVSDDDDVSASHKRKPSEESDAAVAAVDWQAAISSGAISGRSITVPMLKAYCATNSLPRGGKKEELVQRVTDHLRQHRA